MCLKGNFGRTFDIIFDFFLDVSIHFKWVEVRVDMWDFEMSWKMASIQNYLIQKQKYFASQNGMLLYTHIVSKKKMMQVCHLIWICISILQIRNTLPAQNPLFYRKICFKKELNLNTLLYKKKVCQLEIMHDLLLSLLTQHVICLFELLLLPYPSYVLTFIVDLGHFEKEVHVHRILSPLLWTFLLSGLSFGDLLKWVEFDYCCVFY